MCFSPRLVDSRKKRWSVEKMSVKTNAHTINLRIHIIVLSYISQKSFFSCCRYYLGVSGSNLFFSFVFHFSFFFLFSPSARSIFNLSIKKYGKKIVLFSLSCSGILNHRVQFFYNTISKNREEKKMKKSQNKTHVICFLSAAFFVEFGRKKN